MKEDKIDTEPLIIQTQAALASRKREVVAKFQEEVREMPNESFFEF